MSIQFTQASSQYLSLASGLFQEGMGGSFWYRAGIAGGTRGIFRAYDSVTGDYVEITASNSLGNRKFTIQYLNLAALESDAATTTNQWSSNTWINVQFLWLPTQVAIRANGGAFDVGIGHSSTFTSNNMEIGHSTSAYMNGELAEFAIFDGFADTDEDNTILDSWHQRLSPRTHAYATHYWQMLNAADLADQHSGVTLTANNTPTDGANHPPLWYRRPGQLIVPRRTTRRVCIEGRVFSVSA